VWVMSPGDFVYDTDERIHARARRAPKPTYGIASAYLEDLRGPEAITQRITVDDLDVLLLRNDPAQDISHGWQQIAGIDFSRLALRSGVIVLNDPSGLARAASKMYFQLFPAEVRPQTLISRNHDDIRAFIKSQGGRAVLKPLQGSGGTGVFLVGPGSAKNVNQMIDALIRDGYVIAQEYLEAAEKGDTRLFMLNGEAFRHKGHYAAFCRVASGGDVRSNITAGGKVAKVKVTEAHLRIADVVRPKLVADGMFFVGLDIVGDKLMEINVFSPGGLGVAQKFERVDFTSDLVAALERKVGYAASYGRRFDNSQMATL
jgi:glutathione synthase